MRKGKFLVVILVGLLMTGGLILAGCNLDNCSNRDLCNNSYIYYCGDSGCDNYYGYRCDC